MNEDLNSPAIKSPGEFEKLVESGVEDPFSFGGVNTGDLAMGSVGMTDVNIGGGGNLLDSFNTLEGDFATSEISVGGDVNLQKPSIDVQDVCVVCEKVPKKKKVCSRCKIVIYCSRDCQVKHWKVHKKKCKKKK